MLNSQKKNMSPAKGSLSASANRWFGLVVWGFEPLVLLEGKPSPNLRVTKPKHRIRKAEFTVLRLPFAREARRNAIPNILGSNPSK